MPFPIVCPGAVMVCGVEWFAHHVLPLEPKIRGWLLRAGWSPEEVEDLVQESYARLWILAPEQIGHVSGFVFAMIRNLAADQVRRRHVVPIQTMADISRLNVVDPQPSAETLLSDQQEARRLHQAIDGLPPQCRQAFLLHKIDGLSLADTAQRMGLSRSTVEKHIARGMRLCAAVLTAPQTEAAQTAAPAEVYPPQRGRKEEVGGKRQDD